MPTYNESVHDNLSLSDSATRLLRLSVSDSLPYLFDQLTLNWINESVSDTLNLVDFFYANHEGAGDTITITENLQLIGPIYISVSDQINLYEDLSESGGSISLQTSDQLTLIDTATVPGNTTSQSVSDTLSLTDSAARALNPTDNLNITDLIFSYSITKGTSDQINIVESYNLVITHANTSLVDNLVINEGLVFYHIVPPTTIGCPITKTYSPFQISGGPVPSSEPTLVPRPNIILTYPYASPSYSLTLRNPLFNNQEKDTYKRIVRRTRGNQLKIFRASFWPTFVTLNYTLQMLSEADADNFLMFLHTSLGKEIGLLDYLSQQWRGYIITPNAQVSFEVAKVRNVQFEFEGRLA